MRSRQLSIISSALITCIYAIADNPSSGIYLVQQGSGFRGSPVPILSGWDVDQSGGFCVLGSPIQIRDTNSQSRITLKRRFPGHTSGKVVLEFHFLLSKKVDGVTWQLMGGESVATKIVTYGGNICYENSAGSRIALHSYTDNVNYGVKVVVDLSSQLADYYVNGKLYAIHVDLKTPVSSLDAFCLYTSDAGTVTLLQRQTNIWKGYLVNESFLSQTAGDIPDDWICDTEGGEAYVTSDPEISTYPDCIFACMADTNEYKSVSLVKTFESRAGKLNFEFNFVQPVKTDEFCAQLRNADNILVNFQTHNGNLCYVASNGIPVSVWDNYRSNLWYNVRFIIDQETGTGDVTINDIPRVTGVSMMTPPTGLVNNVRFVTSEVGCQDVWLDDIVLSPVVETPTDCVPPPAPVPHGTQLIGVQAFNGWREGTHMGWDWISSDPERSPIIGFYDEHEAEVADWEIKFLVDHCIDFIMPCWYRPQSGTGQGPIKNKTKRGASGYKRARYADSLFYMLNIETVNAPAYSMEDWRDNVVPLLIEHYFRDPRYLVIENKPVVAFFGGIRNTGDETAAQNTLKNQCVEAGFAGATLIGCTTAGDSGYEYMYTYSGNFTAESVSNRISSPSVNWDRSAWDQPYQDEGVWRTATEYENLLLAQKVNLVSKIGLAQTMWLLGNWNEYGEGHFLMPTEGLGFRYLDVIREVFGDGSPHTDIWPTAEQKARINILYPQPRIIVQPKDQQAVIGNTATFDVKAVGFTPCTFQWFMDGYILPGETNTVLSFSPVLPENQDALFSVAISNALNLTVSKDASLSVLEYDPVHKMKITFPEYDCDETLTNFPVLIRLSNNMTNGFSYTQVFSEAGNDLWFTDATGTQELNREIETWNTNGESLIWVQVPELKHDTCLWAYWGDSARALEIPICSTNGATWDETFSAVWHMKEGTGSSMSDSTVNINNGTLYNGTGWAVGAAGSALLFDAEQISYVYAGKNASLALTNNFTVSAWVSPSGYNSEPYYGLINGFLSRGPSSANTINYALQIKDSTTATFIKRTGTEGLMFYNFTVPEIGTGWTHLLLSVLDGTLSLNINGSFCGTKAVGPIAFIPDSDALRLGCIVTYKSETAFSGLLDEVRINNVARSTNWAWASWMNIASNNVFVDKGAVSGGSENWDVNGNNMPDVWEQFYFGSTNAVNGGTFDDWDGDGFCNQAEYIAGTCPTNAGSLLRFDSAVFDALTGKMILRWPSVGGRLYSVESSTNLITGFDEISASALPATPASNSCTIDVNQAKCRFYRVTVEH